jgi:hypothetical protein
MDFALRFVSSASSHINYETMNSGNTQTAMTAMTLAANPIVEKCLTKMANDVTAQVRDKLVDIIIAVLARECEDFDGETVRRLIYAELESTPMTFALEKHAAVSKTKTPKTTKTVELDADGNPIKKVRTPKEKAPKAPKEPKAPKAPKPVLTEEEREAAKLAKQAERKAAKEARKAEKAATKDADKEAAMEAAKAEKAAAKEAAKLAKQAERDAAKEAAKAEKEAAKLAKPAKEHRIPIPWCGVRIPDRCEALRSYHGLFAQCVSDNTETSIFCPSCEKTGAQFGTVTMRAACGLFDYTDPKGKKCVRLANVVDKFEVEGGIDTFIAEAAKHGITIPAEHLEKEVKQRGRPKSSSPRARPATKVATSDTGSGSETETDDEEYQAKKQEKQEKQQQQQQQRKKVTKTVAAAADADAAPKKRGRPAKSKEAAPEPKDDLIQELVASAKKAATPKAVTPAAKSAPTSPELSEDEVSPAPAAVVVAAKPAAAKLSTKPKAAPKPKAPEREQVECDGEKFWRQMFNGEEILVRCSDNLVFCSRDGVGYNIGTWDEKLKTVIEDDEESSDEE